MDVHVDQMHSTVRTSDSEALLEPRVLEQIVQAVVARLEQEQARRRRLVADRRYTTSVSRDERLTGMEEAS